MIAASLLAFAPLFLGPPAGARHGLPRQEAAPVAVPDQVAASGQVAAPAAVAAPDPESGAAFRAGGELVTADEFGRWLLLVLGEREAREFALDWAVGREARRLGVAVSAQDVRAELERELAVRVEKAFLGDRNAWLDELRRTGRSEGEYRSTRGAELEPYLNARAVAAVDRDVPEHHVVREWELQHGRKGRRYDLRMLLLRVVQPMPPEGTPADVRNAEREERKAARLDEARALRARALAGEDLGELAARFSDDETTRANAGRLPQGFSHFGWPPAFLDRLEQVPVGEISEPLYARGGWWLIEVRGVQETPLASVRAELEADLLARGPESDEIGAVQTRLTKDLAVEVLPSTWSRPDGDEWPDAFETALTIGGEPVQRAEYALWLLRRNGQAWARRFVEDRLIESAARAAGIVATDEDVARRTREMLQWRIDNAHHGRREAFLAYIESSGVDEETVLRSLGWRARADLLAEELLLRQRVVTEEEVRRLWLDHYGEDGVVREVRSLAVSIDPGPLEPGWSAEELARRIEAAAESARAGLVDVLRRIEGGEDFAALAERHATPSPPEGVRASVARFRPETWPDEIAAAVEALAPGELTPPLRHGPYWVTFECTGLRRVVFDDVRASLEHELASRRPSSVEVATYRNVLYEAADPQTLPGMYE